MSLEEREVKRSPSIIKYLSGVMAVLFILGGTAILFKYDAIEARLGKGKLGPSPIALGIVLILYGFFRGYRAYRQFSTKDDE
jgi:hypothetical protein